MGAAESNQLKTRSAWSQDFWLVYSPKADGMEALANTVSALYYLPGNFKLMITSEHDEYADKISITDHIELRGRIQFIRESGLPEKAAFFVKNGAALYDEAIPDNNQHTPSVVMTTGATSDLEEDNKNQYTVAAGNPEAIASAALSIARATA